MSSTGSAPPPSLYSNLYKNTSRTTAVSQEERRLIFLQKQKEKRHECADEKRDFSELFENGNGNASMETESCDSESTRRRRNIKCPFAFKLMTGEWLMDVPADLASNWLVKFFVDGIRYLVVANRGITTCYLKNGKSCMRFKSNLPGGSKGCYGHRFTVLDCIYNKARNSFFVFDVLAWNSVSFLNSEAQFRFYWLKTKFNENPDYLQAIAPCSYKFILVDCLPAQLPLIQDCMSNPSCILDADADDSQQLPYLGIIFYHKEGHYTVGRTPLVGWLFSYMLQEKLHIDVESFHLANKPVDYECFEHYVSQKAKKKKYWKRRLDRITNMELESGPVASKEDMSDEEVIDLNDSFVQETMEDEG